jgi:hypothetical protein
VLFRTTSTESAPIETRLFESAKPTPTPLTPDPEYAFVVIALAVLPAVLVTLLSVTTNVELTPIINELFAEVQPK